MGPGERTCQYFTLDFRSVFYGFLSLRFDFSIKPFNSFIKHRALPSLVPGRFGSLCRHIPFLRTMYRLPCSGSGQSALRYSPGRSYSLSSGRGKASPSRSYRICISSCEGAACARWQSLFLHQHVSLSNHRYGRYSAPSPFMQKNCRSTCHSTSCSCCKASLQHGVTHHMTVQNHTICPRRPVCLMFCLWRDH